MRGAGLRPYCRRMTMEKIILLACAPAMVLVGISRVIFAFKDGRRVSEAIRIRPGAIPKDEPEPLYRLADGREVEKIDDMTFRIVETGQIIRRVKRGMN